MSEMFKNAEEVQLQVEAFRGAQGRQGPAGRGILSMGSDAAWGTRVDVVYDDGTGTVFYVRDGKTPIISAAEAIDKSGTEVVITGGPTGTVKFFVKNGKDGKDGAPGESYNLTAADKDEIAEKVAKIVGSESGGTGLTQTEKTLMLTLLKNAEYTANVKATIAQLEAMWTGGSTITFAVTNNLTNVSTSNSAETVTGGLAYTAALTADEGYVLKSVTVMMDGVDVTAEAYADGVVSIVSVSGDIVITAIASESVMVEPVYAVSNVAFDGATEIDTGINLFDADKSWTVASTWTMGDGCDNLATVWASAITGATNNGYFIGLQRQNGWYWRIRCGSDEVKDYTGVVSGAKYIVTKEKGATSAMVYSVVDGVKKATTLNQQSAVPMDANGVGKYDNVSLGKSALDSVYFTGTIDDFRIYNRILDATEINEYLGV